MPATDLAGKGEAGRGLSREEASYSLGWEEDGRGLGRKGRRRRMVS